jgi:glutathione S-transferase
MQREIAAQREIDQQVQDLSLYQFNACPFCVKTRRTVRRLNLPVELRDAKASPQHREALLEGGGAIKVPCLRIQTEQGSEWLYESSDIITYLDNRFGAPIAA